MKIGFNPFKMNFSGTFEILIHPNRKIVATKYPGTLRNRNSEMRYYGWHFLPGNTGRW